MVDAASRMVPPGNRRHPVGVRFAEFQVWPTATEEGGPPADGVPHMNVEMQDVTDGMVADWRQSHSAGTNDRVPRKASR